MIENYVTGGHGFVGSHLMRRLEKKATVMLPHGKKRVEYPMLFKKFFFLSTYGNIYGQNDWTMTLHANLWQPIAAAVSAAPSNPGAFIFVSTSSVLLPVQTPYSRFKFAAEQVLQSMIDLRRRVFIARPYSITGVGEQPSHLIPTLIRSCLSGEPMDFYPDATHDFIDVEDFVDGLLLLSNQENGGLYEFGRGTCYSNLEVRCMVEEITGRNINIRSGIKGRSYDIPEWVCRSKSAQSIGWTAKKTLQQSIAEMVEAFHDDNFAKTLR